MDNLKLWAAALWEATIFTSALVLLASLLASLTHP